MFHQLFQNPHAIERHLTARTDRQAIDSGFGIFKDLVRSGPRIETLHHVTGRVHLVIGLP